MSAKQISETEKQRYGRDKNTVINRSYIEGGEYRKKFDAFSDNKELNRLAYRIAKKILSHRSGSSYEDMYWIDPDTLSIVARIVDSKIEGGIKYTRRINKIVRKKKGLITIHSHPHSLPPSYNDLFCNYKFGYSVGLIICHNGKIYMYSVNEHISKIYYGMLVGKYINRGYNKDEAYRLSLVDLNDSGQIVYKEVINNDV